MDIKDYEYLQSLDMRQFIAKVAASGVVGRKHSEETKRKIAESLRNVYKSEELRANLSVRNIGKKHTEETKKKIALANIGKKKSEATLAKLSVAHKGKVITEEQRKKISLANKGKKRGAQSEEHRRKISASIKKTLLLKKLNLN
jgi:hypothetical protein